MKGVTSYNPSDKIEKVSFTLANKITEREKIMEIHKPDSLIESILSLVSKSNVEEWINKISSFQTRHSKSDFIDKVAVWLKGELEKNGHSDIMFHDYTESEFNLKNVICDIKGNSDKLILVCAHYDSRMEDLEDSQSRSPGAVDNASGMAVILEISRIISNLKFENSIQLVFFSGEEQGLWGSKHYAKFIKDNHIPLNVLVNLDMVGHHIPDKPVCIVERDHGNKVLTNDQSSEEFAEVVEEIANLYTGLRTKPGPIYDSDYMPFEELGYTVIGLYDGGAEAYPYYHTSLDESKYVDNDYTIEVAKLVLVTLLKEGKIVANPI